MAKVCITNDYCKSCGLCIDVCKKQVLQMGKITNSIGYEVVEAQEDKECVGCKQCAVMCPEGAIEVYK